MSASIDIQQFWNSLVQCKLLDETAQNILESKFNSAAVASDNEPETLANWLCQQKAISRFQADILLANQGLRLRYGNYLLVADLETNSSQLLKQYLARHILTKHPVKLTFLAGKDTTDLNRWLTVRSATNSLITGQPTWLTDVYDAVAVPEYRFVVSEIPTGKPLADCVPERARLPENKWQPIVEQIARGLSELHVRNLTLGPNIERQIRLQKSGRIQLEPNWAAPTQWSATDDIYQFAITWYRLASGRQPTADQTTGKFPLEEFLRLKKYNINKDTNRLLQSMLLRKSEKRPTAMTVAQHLQKLNIDPPALSDNKTPTKTLAAYQQWLAKSLEVDAGLPVASGEISTADLPQPAMELVSPEEVDQEFIPVPEATRARSKILFPLIGSMLTLSAIIGFVVFSTISKPHGTVVTENNTSTGDPVNPTEIAATTSPDGSDHSADAATVAASSDANSEFVVQDLIADDSETLWETPTTGAPIDFSHVPSAPKIAFSIRPAELLAEPQGQRLLQGLGPTINSKLTELQQSLGVTLPEIEHLLITLHSNNDFVYEPFFIVTLSQYQPELPKTWATSETGSVNDLEYQIRDDQHCFHVLADPNTADPNDDLTDNSTNAPTNRFIFASKWLIEESLSLGGANAIGGALKQLATDSDTDRHLTVMFLRAGLFNDEGFKLMGPDLAWLNRRLSLAIDQFVRGVSVSLHVDEGTYLELDFSHQLDLKSKQLQTQITNELTNITAEIETYSGNLQSNQFWDIARSRAAAMVADLATNLRIGEENNQVLCNGWYHHSAAHNWLASTELFLAFGESQYVVAANPDAPKTPQTLDELLSRPRDLSVSTSPDLVILIGNLQQEIIDDYGDLPFDFEIKLLGSDLSKEGITQNQRPSDFDLKNTSLADILTEIMVRANPNKNITGAADPECKMVWAVADDPAQPGRKIIAITTRAAAAEKSYQLPPAFIVK